MFLHFSVPILSLLANFHASLIDTGALTFSLLINFLMLTTMSYVVSTGELSYLAWRGVICHMCGQVHGGESWPWLSWIRHWRCSVSRDIVLSSTMPQRQHPTSLFPVVKMSTSSTEPVAACLLHLVTDPSHTNHVQSLSAKHWQELLWYVHIFVL